MLFETGALAGRERGPAYLIRNVRRSLVGRAHVL